MLGLHLSRVLDNNELGVWRICDNEKRILCAAASACVNEFALYYILFRIYSIHAYLVRYFDVAN